MFWVTYFIRIVEYSVEDLGSQPYFIILMQLATVDPKRSDGSGFAAEEAGTEVGPVWTDYEWGSQGTAGLERLRAVSATREVWWSGRWLLVVALSDVVKRLPTSATRVTHLPMMGVVMMPIFTSHPSEMVSC